MHRQRACGGVDHLAHGLDGRGDRAARIDRAHEAARERRLHDAQHAQPALKSLLTNQRIRQDGRANPAEQQFLENRNAVELADVAQFDSRTLDLPIDDGAKAVRNREVEIRHPGERDRGLPRCSKSRRPDEHHLFASERRVRQRGRIPVVRHDGDVDAAEFQPFLEEYAQALGDPEVHIREGLPASLHDGLAKARRQRRRHTQCHVAARMARGMRDRLADLVDIAQHGLAHVEEGQACFRRLDPAGCAEEQFGAQFLFQNLDLPAQGRLGDVERLGRLAEVPQFRDVDEIPDLSDVHGKIPGCGQGIVARARHHSSRTAGWPKLIEL
jgi:hypothetical protein